MNADTHCQNDCAGQSTGSWEAFVEKRTAQWVRHTEHWLGAPCERLLVRYEDLHENAGEQLRAMLLWLGLDVNAEDVERAVEESRLSRLRKKASSHDRRHFLGAARSGGLRKGSPDHNSP